MSDTLTPYPKHLGTPGGKRVLRLSEFPKRSETADQQVLDYLAQHNIPPDKLQGEQHSYASTGGITFLTHGLASAAYQVRYCPPRLRYGRLLRFDLPSGIDMGDHLYYTSRGHRAGLVIVEGSADALAAYSHGYTGVSLLGANLTEARAGLLKSMVKSVTHDGPIVFIPDNDHQGQQAVRRMTQYNVGVRVAQLPLGAKDLCDLDYSDREQFLQEVLYG